MKKLVYIITLLVIVLTSISAQKRVNANEIIPGHFTKKPALAAQVL